MSVLETPGEFVKMLISGSHSLDSDSLGYQEAILNNSSK